jgi:hypothetical protein
LALEGGPALGGIAGRVSGAAGEVGERERNGRQDNGRKPGSRNSLPPIEIGCGRFRSLH